MVQSVIETETAILLLLKFPRPHEAGKKKPLKT